MSELPINWIEVRFLEIFDIQGGTQPPKSTFIYEPKENYVRLLQIRDFGDKPVPTYVFDIDGLKRCNEDDILIARYGASIGRILTGMSGAYNVAMAKVNIPVEINRRFTYHLLNSKVFQSPLGLISRSAQNGFNKDDLSEFKITIPPLKEQKRIADKLDSMLARMDACRERLDRIPAILKRFRQAVLAAATSGKLTEEWRKTTEYTEEWTINPLKALCSRVSVGHVGQTSQFYTTSDIGIPFLRSQNVRPGYVSIEGLAYITQDFHNQLQKSQLQAGDLLIVRVGANRGDSCVLPNIFDKVNCANIVFARPTKILPAYLSIFFQSPSCQEDLLNKTVGGAQGVINTKSVELINVKVPPHAEQTEIVRRVEELFAYADRIEARYQAARAQADKLTPAILAKAFRGELVPQDPNDEPASVLLDRIRASRAENAVTPKPKRSRAITSRKTPDIG